MRPRLFSLSRSCTPQEGGSFAVGLYEKSQSIKYQWYKEQKYGIYKLIRSNKLPANELKRNSFELLVRAYNRIRSRNMEMPYIIHGGLSDDVTLLPLEHEITEEIIIPEMQRDMGEQFFRKTPREHLNAAKKALADGYKQHKDPTKAVWGRVVDAQRHLSVIDPKSKEYSEARHLMDEVVARMKAMEKVSAMLTKRLMIRQREMLVDELEFFYLAKGFDARISVSGPDKSCLKMECPPLSEVFILKMVQDTDFLVYLDRAGFKKVTLGDGEGFSWTYSFGI